MEATAGRPAAFFDLDKTIIAKSSTLAFSRPFYDGGLISRVSVLRSAYAQFVFLVGGADHDQMERMRRYLSEQATGWDVQTVKKIVADTLHHIVDPLVYDEAVGLIAHHHDEGRDVVIVSTSGAEVVEPIGEMLGADHVIATDMVQLDGRYTGEIEFYAYAENKAVAIARLAAARGLRPVLVVRLQRLGQRHPDARGRGTPVRSQPRQGPAADGGAAWLAGARLQQAGPPPQASAVRDPPNRGSCRARGRRGGRWSRRLGVQTLTAGLSAPRHAGLPMSHRTA